MMEQKKQLPQELSERPKESLREESLLPTVRPLELLERVKELELKKWPEVLPTPLIETYKGLYSEDTIKDIIEAWEGPHPEAEGKDIDSLIGEFLDMNKEYFLTLESARLWNYRYSFPKMGAYLRRQESGKFFEKFERMLYALKIENPRYFFERFSELGYKFQNLEPRADIEQIVDLNHHDPFSNVEPFFDFAMVALREQGYSTVMPLASGACSSTAVVKDDEGNHFVLKVPHPRLRIESSLLERMVDERSFDDMIRCQRRILMTLPSHRNIARDYESINVLLNGKQTKGILSESIARAQSLEQRFSQLSSSAVQHRATEYAALIDCGLQLVDGLRHLRNHDIVHKDLWAENILVDESGTVKIIDFGFAERIGKLTSVHGKRAATPPPGTPDEKYDFWSLGAILYTLLSGKERVYPLKKKRGSEGYREPDYSKSPDYSDVPLIFRNMIRNIIEKTKDFDYGDVREGLNYIKQKLEAKVDEPAKKTVNLEVGEKKVTLAIGNPFVRFDIDGKPMGYMYVDEYYNLLREEGERTANLYDNQPIKPLNMALLGRDLDPNTNLRLNLEVLSYQRRGMIKKVKTLHDAMTPMSNSTNLGVPELDGVDVLVVSLSGKAFLPRRDGADDSDTLEERIYKIKQRYPLLDIVSYASVEDRGRIEKQRLREKFAGIGRIVYRTKDIARDFDKFFPENYMISPGQPLTSLNVETQLVLTPKEKDGSISGFEGRSFWRWEFKDSAGETLVKWKIPYNEAESLGLFYSANCPRILLR